MCPKTRSGSDWLRASLGRAAELAAKRLELLRTLVPTAKRVAALMNPAEPTIFAANRRDVEAAAGAMELQLRLAQNSCIVLHL